MNGMCFSSVHNIQISNCFQHCDAEEVVVLEGIFGCLVELLLGVFGRVVARSCHSSPYEKKNQPLQ